MSLKSLRNSHTSTRRVASKGYRANTFEGQANATALTTTNSASGSGEAFQSVLLDGTAAVTYDTSTSAHGATSMKISVPSGSSAHVRWEGLTRTKHQYGRGYFNFPTTPGGTLTIMHITQLNVVNVAFIRIDSSRHIVVSDSDGNNATTSTSQFTLNTWLRLEWHVNNVSEAEVRIFLSKDATTPDEVITALGNTIGTPDMSEFMMGDTYTYYVDCAIADAPNWPGPYQRTIGMQAPAQHIYIEGQEGVSVSAAQPDRYFSVAYNHNIQLVRVFYTYDAIFNLWKSSATPVIDAIEKMCNDAAKYDCKLILSPYINTNAINALGSTTYGSDSAAAVALTTSGSTPWTTLESWFSDVLTRVGSHNGVFSFEIGNEIAYLADYVSTTTYLAFLTHFNAYLKTNGAKASNGPGGYVGPSLTDAQVLTYATNLDYIDGHFYPADISTSTSTDADNTMNTFETWVARVRTLTGRPGFPVIVGEVGTQPSAWFQQMLSRATSDDYIPSFWLFDGDPGDSTTPPYYQFNDQGLRPTLFDYLKSH